MGVGCDWSRLLPGTSDAFEPHAASGNLQKDLKHQWLVSDNDRREILL